MSVCCIAAQRSAGQAQAVLDADPCSCATFCITTGSSWQQTTSSSPTRPPTRCAAMALVHMSQVAATHGRCRVRFAAAVCTAMCRLLLQCAVSCNMSGVCMTHLEREQCCCAPTEVLSCC